MERAVRLMRNRKPGWLLYSGDLGVISAEVLSADMSFTRLDVTSIASMSRRFYGPADVKFTAQLTEKMEWERYPAGSKLEQPNIGALLMLARKYPEEYRRLCEAESVLKALDW